MRLRLSALIPLAGVVVGIITDPAVLAILPSKYSHLILSGSAILGVLFPGLVTRKPKEIEVPSYAPHIPDDGKI